MRTSTRALLRIVPLSLILAAGPRAGAAADRPPDHPCPGLEPAMAAARLSPSKAAELAIDAALEACREPGEPIAHAPNPNVQLESEPNGTSGTATVLSFTGPVAIVRASVVPAADEDFFRFTAPAGARVWMMTDTGGGQAPGADSRDTVVHLFEADGSTLIELDDDDGTGNYGDGSIETELSSTIAGRTLTAGGVYFVRVRGFSPDNVVNPYSLYLFVTQVAGASEVEANETAATAMPVAHPIGLVQGSISAPGDVDYYSVPLITGNILVTSVDADPERDGTGTDLVVEVRDSSDVLLLAIDSSTVGSPTNPAAESAPFKITSPGTYFVKIRHQNPSGTGTYHLALATAASNPMLPDPRSTSVDTPGNDVWEPGESVNLSPSWANESFGSISVTGTLSNLEGPPGATYAISDSAANYGTIGAGILGSCTFTGNCYAASASNPAVRPAAHWDLYALEQLSNGVSKTWTYHIGASFTDAPTSHIFYPYIETLLHRGVTGGCGGTLYCPGNPARREQMAVFVLKAKEGPCYFPPEATGIFADVPVSDPFAPWIEELYRRGVVAGCGPGPTFCPDNPVTRQQMAVFLIRTKEGGVYVPPPCTGVFLDVPCSNGLAPYIEEIYHRGIAAGCGGNSFCPGSPTTRGQMAPFLAKTFALELYGP